MIRAQTLPPLAYLRECFELVGGRLLWKERPRHHFATEAAWKCHNSKLAGKDAGRVMRGHPYRQVLVGGRRVLVHRVIAAMVGLDLSGVIDHIDGDPTNNLPENLRACTQAQNSRNNGGWRKKTTPLGVHRKSNGRYCAYIRESGRHVHLGTFIAMEDALEARRAAEARVYGEFSRSSRTSKMGKREFAEFVEFVQAVAVDRGVEIV